MRHSKWELINLTFWQSRSPTTHQLQRFMSRVSSTQCSQTRRPMWDLTAKCLKYNNSLDHSFTLINLMRLMRWLHRSSVFTIWWLVSYTAILGSPWQSSTRRDPMRGVRLDLSAEAGSVTMHSSSRVKYSKLMEKINKWALAWKVDGIKVSHSPTWKPSRAKLCGRKCPSLRR